MKYTILLISVFVLASHSLMPVYANGLNEYEHISGSGRLTMNKYRALRYVLPDEIYKQALEQTGSVIGLSGGGINIGTVLPGATAPRELNIFIDGDVVNFAR